MEKKKNQIPNLSGRQRRTKWSYIPRLPPQSAWQPETSLVKARNQELTVGVPHGRQESSHVTITTTPQSLHQPEAAVRFQPRHSDLGGKCLGQHPNQEPVTAALGSLCSFLLSRHVSCHPHNGHPQLSQQFSGLVTQLTHLASLNASLSTPLDQGGLKGSQMGILKIPGSTRQVPISDALKLPSIFKFYYL